MIGLLQMEKLNKRPQFVGIKRVCVYYLWSDIVLLLLRALCASFRSIFEQFSINLISSSVGLACALHLTSPLQSTNNACPTIVFSRNFSLIGFVLPLKQRKVS